ncbi:MAG: hypothetical protein NXI04_17510 [Planctomycetaceae bacterium]|nr:hypothetical protein [Planctomycetaceae bacterium]
MMGSPWNPFFDQVIPGTSKRYDGRLVDNVDPKQSGGFNAIRLPQNVAVLDNLGTVQAILNRTYEMSGPPVPIESEVVTYGALYNTGLASSIRRTAFCWWHTPSVSFNDRYPRVLYKSDPDFRGYCYFLGAGFAHTGINFPQEAIQYPPQDYTAVWSLWLTDDIPEAEGGSPEFWADVPGTTLVEPGELGETYPLWVNEGGFDGDVPAGSRIVAGLDLNRRSKLINVTTSIENLPIYVEPWYRSN